MKSAIEAIKWPQGLEEPFALRSCREAYKTLVGELKEIDARQNAQIESIGKQIARLKIATSRGDLKMARGVHKKITTKIARIDLEKSTRLAEQWDKADKSFVEMVDWKEFAVRPKYIELCEQMEALAGSKNSPQQQAEQIKKLQQNWKKLDALAPDELWQRFQAAGEIAYQPCVAFYAEQDEVRANNLAQRKLVVQKLKELAALPEQEQWQANPDWKALRTGYAYAVKNGENLRMLIDKNHVGLAKLLASKAAK